MISVDKEGDCFQVHLEEKNTSTDDPDRANLLSKGFFPLITVQDFPIRGHKVFLHIKRRRWLNTKTQKVVYRDWTEVEKGTRMTSEFARYAAAAFFKGNHSIPIPIASIQLGNFMVLRAKICYAITVLIRVVLKIGAKEVMLRTGFYTLKIWAATYQLMRQAYRMESFIRF